MELWSFYTSAFAHFNSIISHLDNIINSFKVEHNFIRKNTFDIKIGYELVNSQSTTKRKDDDISTRKNVSMELSLSENIDKGNKSIF